MTGEFKTHFLAIEEVEPIKTCGASEGEKHHIFPEQQKEQNTMTLP